MFRTLGFTLSTLGSVPSNVFKVPKTTVNIFDGTDPKVDRIKPKVRNAIFFPCVCGLDCFRPRAILFYFFNLFIYNDTSKEKHSLTRKLVGYRNWRQRWCKKEGNKVLGKDK